jgi:hypothetical protein
MQRFSDEREKGKDVFQMLNISMQILIMNYSRPLRLTITENASAMSSKLWYGTERRLSFGPV